MTKDELFTLIAQHKSRELVDAVADLSEAERKKLSTTASAIYRAIDQSSWGTTPRKKEYAETLKRLRECGGKLNRSHAPFETARLAALAMCPLSVVKSIGANDYRRKNGDLMIKIVADRKPDWVGAWVDACLKSEWPRISWENLRELIKRGLCEKPDCDEYVQLFVGGATGGYWRKEGEEFIPLSMRLKNEPDLLDDEVWRLFRSDNSAFHGLGDYFWKHVPHHYETWTKALVKLSAEGVLDRKRLLDEALSSLTSGFKNNTLSGFISFFEAMNPNIDELLARQTTFMNLLSSPTPHIVTFAIKQLKALSKAKRLDGAAFVAAAPGVFNVRTKTQPKAALSLLKQEVQRDRKLLGRAALAAAEAVSHESADVQAAALKLLDQWRAKLDEASAAAVGQALADRIEDIAAAHRARAQQLLAALGVETIVEEATAAPDELGALEKDLLARAAALESKWSKRGGVDAMVEALKGGTPPPPLGYDILDVPLLSGIEPIEPIGSLDELLDTVAHALEVTDDAIAIERILDGISRFCDQYPHDFETRTGPLRKRIEDVAASGSTRGLFATSIDGLRRLLVYWLHRQPYPAHSDRVSYFAADAILRSFDHRCQEIGQRVHSQQAAPLLAMPTHRFGWIDPRLLVARVLEYQRRGFEIPLCDLIQALFRLPGDHRDEARNAAGEIEGEVGEALRWALGGDDLRAIQRSKESSIFEFALSWLRRIKGKQEADARDHRASLWIAAGRAREPRGDLTVLEEKGIVDEQPDGTRAARYEWKAYTESRNEYTWARVRFTQPPTARDDGKTSPRPSVALHETDKRYNPFGHLNAAALDWIGLIWPANTDPFLKGGVQSLIGRIDSASSVFDPNHAFLRCLFQPDVLWTEMASLAWWLAMIGRDADARGLAIDAIIEAVQDGRAHPQPLAEVLIQLSQGGWLKLNRLAETLGEVARVSPLHQWLVADVLMRFLGAVEVLPRDAHHVMALLLNQLTDLGLTLDDAARSKFQGVKGSSKSAKLIRSLVKLESTPRSSFRDAMLDLLRARLERAGRWGSSE